MILCTTLKWTIELKPEESRHEAPFHKNNSWLGEPEDDKNTSTQQILFPPRETIVYNWEVFKKQTSCFLRGPVRVKKHLFWVEPYHLMKNGSKTFLQMETIISTPEDSFLPLENDKNDLIMIKKT